MPNLGFMVVFNGPYQTNSVMSCSQWHNKKNYHGREGYRSKKNCCIHKSWVQVLSIIRKWLFFLFKWGFAYHLEIRPWLPVQQWIDTSWFIVNRQVFFIHTIRIILVNHAFSPCFWRLLHWHVVYVTEITTIRYTIVIKYILNSERTEEVSPDLTFLFIYSILFLVLWFV